MGRLRGVLGVAACLAGLPPLLPAVNLGGLVGSGSGTPLSMFELPYTYAHGNASAAQQADFGHVLAHQHPSTS